MVETAYLCYLSEKINDMCKYVGLSYDTTTLRPNMHGEDDDNEVYTVHLKNGKKFTHSCQVSAKLMALDYLEAYTEGYERAFNAGCTNRY